MLFDCIDVNVIYVIWLPVIIFLAVYAAIFAEAGKLGLQVELTFATFEAAHMPLFVHRQQVVTVGYLSPAAGTQGHSLAVDGRQALQNNKRHVRYGVNIYGSYNNNVAWAKLSSFVEFNGGQVRSRLLHSPWCVGRPHHVMRV